MIRRRWLGLSGRRIEGLAVIAARRSETTALLGALGRLRRLEVSGFAAADSAVIHLGAVPAVGRALRALATAADTTVYAEVIDDDPATGSADLANVRHRTIYQVTPGRPPSDVGVSSGRLRHRGAARDPPERWYHPPPIRPHRVPSSVVSFPCRASR